MEKRSVPLPPISGPTIQNQAQVTKVYSMGSSRLAEMAGSTAAECVAVACCCPCTIVNVLIVTVVKVPAGLYRKALKRKRHIQQIGMLQPMSYYDRDFPFHTVSAGTWPEKSPTMEVLDMEKQMSNFYGNGFWRNPSERE